MKLTILRFHLAKQTRQRAFKQINLSNTYSLLTISINFSLSEFGFVTLKVPRQHVTGLQFLENFSISSTFMINFIG